MTTRTRTLVTFCAVAGCLAGVVLLTRDTRADHVRQVLAGGAVEVRSDSFGPWWARAARCLGEDTALVPVRVFVGGREPKDWRAPWDRTPGVGGRTQRGDTALIWVVALGDSLFAHEAWHAHKQDGHPAAVFGPPPRCGLSPAPTS